MRCSSLSRPYSGSAYALLAVLLIMPGAPVAAAVSTGENPMPRTADAALWPVFSDRETATIVQVIADGRDACGRLPAEYRIDCLRATLKTAARQVPSNRPDYDKARSILNNATRQLDRIVEQSLDTAAPATKLGRETVRAVRKDAARSAMSAARLVVAEAETLLVRSAENSQRRMVHYAQIAEAVGSTKVLLRS